MADRRTGAEGGLARGGFQGGVQGGRRGRRRGGRSRCSAATCSVSRASAGGGHECGRDCWVGGWVDCGLGACIEVGELSGRSATEVQERRLLCRLCLGGLQFACPFFILAWPAKQWKLAGPWHTHCPAAERCLLPCQMQCRWLGQRKTSCPICRCVCGGECLDVCA